MEKVDENFNRFELKFKFRRLIKFLSFHCFEERRIIFHSSPSNCHVEEEKKKKKFEVLRLGFYLDSSANFRSVPEFFSPNFFLPTNTDTPFFFSSRLMFFPLAVVTVLPFFPQIANSNDSPFPSLLSSKVHIFLERSQSYDFYHEIIHDH